MMKVDRRLALHFDWALFFFTLIIPCVGLLVLYSAGYDPDSTVSFLGWLTMEFHSAACAKQALYLIGGLVVMAVGMLIPTSWFQRYCLVLYGIALLLLLMVAGFGVVVNGSRRWLDLGVIKLQPAEFMKLGLLITMARVRAIWASMPCSRGSRALLNRACKPANTPPKTSNTPSTFNAQAFREV
jgi:rod shape determining protein RodA